MARNKSIKPLHSKLERLLLSRGITNFTFLSNSYNRSWPFWVSRHINPALSSSIYENNYLSFMNSKYRNWTHLRDRLTSKSLIVDPSGLIHIEGKPFSIELSISVNKKIFKPHLENSITQKYDYRFNSIITSYDFRV